MRTSVHTIVVVILFLSLAPFANFLVVTKHNLNTFLKYRYHVRIQNPELENQYSFDKPTLVNYCEQLRQAKIFTLFDSDLLSEFGHPHQRSLPHNMTAESLEIERNQMGLQIVKFKLENSDHLIAQLIFQCMDFDGELKWFIAPAAIPDSAFLFIVQPSIANVFARQQNNTEHMVVPARFVAIIDESATELQEFVVPVITKSIRINSLTGRDPLCDLSPQLKYRLCAIAAAKVEEHLDFAGFLDDFATYRDNWYYLKENPADACRPVPVTKIRPKITNMSADATVEMLRCSIASHQYNSNIMPYYLGLNMINDTQIVYYTESLGFIYYSLMRSHFEIPLLKHIDKYANTG